MAAPEDYVGKRFGCFAITKHLGAGATAEAFICEHLPSRIDYVLRLDIEEDILWDDEPLIPPVNGDFERKGAQIVWFLGNDEKPQWPKLVYMHYQVIDQKHVIPLSSPWRLEHALTAVEVQSLRDAVMPELDNFSLYSDIAIGMFAEAAFGDLTEKEFLSRWGKLCGGSHLLAMMGPDIKNPGRTFDSDKVFGLLTQQNGTDPEFAENRLLWLCAAARHELISLDELLETLMCRWFRGNIAAYEVEQFLAVNQVLQGIKHYHSDTIDLSKQWTAQVLGRLAQEPFTPSEYPQLFVKKENEPPTVASDGLVLQQLGSYRSGVLVR